MGYQCVHYYRAPQCLSPLQPAEPLAQIPMPNGFKSIDSLQACTPRDTAANLPEHSAPTVWCCVDKQSPPEYVTTPGVRDHTNVDKHHTQTLCGTAIFAASAPEVH